MTQNKQKPGFIQKIRSELDFVKGNFRIIVLSWLVLDFFMEMPFTFFPRYVEALGGTASTVGLILGVNKIASAVVQIPGGYLADKYGRKWIITTMTFMAALSQLFYAFAPTWEWLLVGAVMSGFSGIYSPALNAIVADSLPDDKRGLGFSIIHLIAGVSTTPAPLVAGYLLTVYGLVPSVRITYGLVVFGLSVAALLRTRLTETVENPEKIDISKMMGEYPVALRESISVWKLVPRAAFILFITEVSISFTSGLFQPIMALYIIKDLGLGDLNYSYIIASLFISTIFLALPAGRLIDKIGKKKPIIFSLFLWMAAILLIVYGNFYRLILGMSIVGLLMVLMSSAISSLNAELVPSKLRGRVGGARGFFALLASAIGQFTGGWLYDNVDHQLPFLIQIVLVIIPIVLVYFYIEEPKAGLDKPSLFKEPG